MLGTFTPVLSGTNTILTPQMSILYSFLATHRFHISAVVLKSLRVSVNAGSKHCGNNIRNGGIKLGALLSSVLLVFVLESVWLMMLPSSVA